ncbi:hypothetical protein OBBRIDRAFT_729818 [Obba rivulosa]|uniref:Cytochrome c oxidase assembly protein COX20, mitochondrial n=1 Tax=Obba rivulosa TaxID=1052685 RepID=A0A8E2DLD5_9APHY|nr:hypothetical protein OBBRIDRAFT_729818 [Obba rivulosa]
MDPSSPPSTDPASSSPPKKRFAYQTETTGSYWEDVKEAWRKINEIPCARNSLLSGIASGAGVGVIRGMSAGAFAASNWAVGTFMLISLGTWTICRRAREDERRRLQQVVEKIPARFVKKQEEPSAEKPSQPS